MLIEGEKSLILCFKMTDDKILQDECSMTGFKRKNINQMLLIKCVDKLLIISKNSLMKAVSLSVSNLSMQVGVNTGNEGKKSAIFSEKQLLVELFQLLDPLAKSLQQIQLQRTVQFFFMLTIQYSLLLISKFLSLCCHCLPVWYKLVDISEDFFA